MIDRILHAYLHRDAGYCPVVTLTGPRQSGKTTLAQAAFPDHDYVSLEETEPRLFAREDPRGFLARHRGPAVIDEARRVPDLFSYIQSAVDGEPRPGRFIFTGSHNFLLMKQVSQTPAGRCGLLHLLPFWRAELEGQAQREPVDTPRRWISVLKTSFIILSLAPHHRNFNKRLIKSPQLYFYDTGLACHLLRIPGPDQLEAHPLRGPLFENFIIAEAAKAYMHHRRSPPIYFWGDRTGHEIDPLIEEGADLYRVEIKFAQTVSREMLQPLLWWRRQAGKLLASATPVYGGSDAYQRNGVAVRSWFAV